MRSATSGAIRTLLVVLVLAGTALLAAACSGTAAAPDLSVRGAAAQPAAAPAAAGGTTDGSGGSGQGAATTPAPIAVGTGGSGTAAITDTARIVRTGSLQLDVKDVKASLNAARDAVVGMGGYIGASQQSTDGASDGASIVATVTYRIPEPRWEDALAALRSLGDEVGEKTDAAEVTNQIVDLAARIRNLQASETALVGYAANAAKISDLLEVEARLTDVRGQIEQLTAQQKNLENQASYGTLAVTFGTQVAAVQKAAAQWDPKTEVDRAGASLIGFLQTLTTAGIWFAIVWLPMLIAVLIVVGIGIFVARRLGFLRRTVPPPTPAAG